MFVSYAICFSSASDATHINVVACSQCLRFLPVKLPQSPESLPLCLSLCPQVSFSVLVVASLLL